MTPLRQSSVDALRAMALCGILLMNIEYFTRPLSSVSFGLDPNADMVSYAMAWIIRLLVHGKFWHIFALLFGASLVWFAQRHPHRSSAWRLFTLLILGAIHGIFIWGGDILSMYAIAGMLTLCLWHRSWSMLFYMCMIGTIVSMITGSVWIDWFMVLLIAGLVGVTRLPWWAKGILLWSIPQLLALLMYGLSDPAFMVDQQRQLLQQSHQEVVQASSWWASIQWRSPLWLEHNLDGLSVLIVSGLMLMGAHLAQSNLFTRSKLPQWWVWAGVIGLLVSSASLIWQPTWNDQDTTIYLTARALFQMSALPMALMYMYVGWQLLQSCPRVGKWLAPAGRMTLSLYIMQSLVFVALATTLNDWPLSVQFIIAIIFAIVQLMLAHWWMRHHSQGPMEKMWTMVQTPKMR